jgi:hypothetical protein
MSRVSPVFHNISACHTCPCSTGCLQNSHLARRTLNATLDSSSGKQRNCSDDRIHPYFQSSKRNQHRASSSRRANRRIRACSGPGMSLSQHSLHVVSSPVSPRRKARLRRPLESIAVCHRGVAPSGFSSIGDAVAVEFDDCMICIIVRAIIAIKFEATSTVRNRS